MKGFVLAAYLFVSGFDLQDFHQGLMCAVASSVNTRVPSKVSITLLEAALVSHTVAPLLSCMS